MKKVFYLGVLLSVFLSGCVAAYNTNIENPEPNQVTEKIDIYFTKRPVQEYTEVEIVEILSFNIFHQKKHVLNKLLLKAEAAEADGIIITDFGYINMLFIPFHKIECVFINYSNDE